MDLRTNFQSILLIDFDHTICDVDFPKILGLRAGAKTYINKLYDENHCIIINTCRCGEELKAAKNFLIENGVKFHLANENHPALMKFFKEDSRKLSGDIHIDDKNLEAMIDKSNLHWLTIYKNIYKVITSPFFKSILRLTEK